MRLKIEKIDLAYIFDSFLMCQDLVTLFSLPAVPWTFLHIPLCNFILS